MWPQIPGRFPMSAVDVIGPPSEPAPPPLSPAPRYHRLEHRPDPQTAWRSEMVSRDVVTMERLYGLYVSRGEEARITALSDEETVQFVTDLALACHERGILASYLATHPDDGVLDLLPPEVQDHYRRATEEETP